MVVQFIEWIPTTGLEERSSKELANTKPEKKSGYDGTPRWYAMGKRRVIRKERRVRRLEAFARVKLGTEYGTSVAYLRSHHFIIVITEFLPPLSRLFIRHVKLASQNPFDFQFDLTLNTVVR